MQPMRDLVLIEVDPPKDKTGSGILLVEDWKSLPPTGTVLAVGPQVQEPQVGDRVMFERYASIILEKNQRMCKASHIHAKLEGSDA